MGCARRFPSVIQPLVDPPKAPPFINNFYSFSSDRHKKFSKSAFGACILLSFEGSSKNVPYSQENF